MKTFLAKLERRGGYWVSRLDDQLQQPIVRVMTGEVFMHRAAENDPVRCFEGSDISRSRKRDDNRDEL